MAEVLVLNATFQPLQILNLRRAIKLVVKGTVEIVKHVDGRSINSSSLSYPMPSVIRLHRYVNYQPKPAAFSKRNVVIRDKYTCQYCGEMAPRGLTVDHIVPQSKGGLSTWENTVACCKKCNAKKGNKSLKESGMILNKMPKRPNPYAFMRSASIHREWDEFLYI